MVIEDLKKEIRKGMEEHVYFEDQKLYKHEALSINYATELYFKKYLPIINFDVVNEIRIYGIENEVDGRYSNAFFTTVFKIALYYGEESNFLTTTIALVSALSKE